MIVAKTSMERMPENCWDCDLEIAIMCLPTRKRIQNDGRPDWCPLAEVDETLPAQLTAAEAGIQKMLQLMPVALCKKFCKRASANCGAWGECNPEWKGNT